MKTDMELLELAAKAAGYHVKGWVGNRLSFYNPITMSGEEHWNSLENGGDALRLSVKLQISVSQNIFEVGVCTINLALAGIFIKEECRNQDRLTATCRAITIAAAAIGEGME